MISSGGFCSSFRCEPISSSAASRSVVDLLVVLAEGVASRERDPAVALAEEAEEMRREFIQPLAGSGPVPACRTSSCGATTRHVAAQVLER